MNGYFHSVVLSEDSCKGCTHCIKRCPTEAIRVRDRKASISGERCIDCGECIRVCPYHAQKAVTDDLEDIKKYKYRIALVPPAVHGQFDTGIGLGKILKAVEMLGFDEAYDISPYCDIASAIIQKYYLEEEKITRPAIYSDCPVIIRLIQLRYPDLLENVIPLVSPMEIAARLIKTDTVSKKNFKREDVGVFYLTPCPARVTSVRVLIGLSFAYTDGLISIRKIFGSLSKNLGELQSLEKVEGYEFSGRGLKWGIIGGQSQSIVSKNYLAVDGIENVINVFEELELGKLKNMDFVEAYACTGGCVGGPLLVENAFVAKTRVKHLADTTHSPKLIGKEKVKEFIEAGLFTWTEEIKPKKMVSLDPNIGKAIQKMEKVEEILKKLPGIDCGSCGAPTCRALAEDIVNGRAREVDCVFRLREKINEIDRG
ncbi:MAG: [Fe-Fe] hydrogenase large subunit C-terminal domain-containing protein [Firmicutes bacterium]|nr:[Fe-Fe] hydrogenase large subunit C-terminal domain-containing protein [Bacillota bacterium]MDD3298145.1 [Fe-Fe] hydrogenase large subunit C-terminal domain-containing protein [Bacillota bacterium]MDD3851850.1 [Fe-Fe] hydrogenase large subunit C-terminal domain-containing protein [Bacillota bacterium]MDD4708311.1 [Fe-Fe] hydrogenase large subunit C-terminal domain-containing protein [Bacillota bacterium]